MKPFIIKGLKRDKDYILPLLKKVGNSIIAKTDITVMFPARYINKEMAFMGNSVKVISIVCIIDKSNNKYAILNAPCMIELTPYMTNEVDVDGVEHILLEFNKNDIFMPDVKIIKDDGLIYSIFDEFLIQGNVPWYMKYDDMSDVFKLADKYAGTKIGNNPMSMEIISSIIARDSEDKTVFFRKLAKDFSAMKKTVPSFVALMDIYYTFTSTLSKISGSYFKEGITSAIVNPEKSSNTVSEMIVN